MITSDKITITYGELLEKDCKIYELQKQIYDYNNALKEANKNIKTLINRIDKAIEYIEKYLHEHVIDEYPDEQSIFYDEEDRFISNAKEVLLNILKGVENNDR